MTDAPPTLWALRAGALPALVVLAVVLGFEIGYGAAAGDALLYLGYEFGFVIAPGWLAYRALSPQPGGPLRQIALGWALGYVLEILAFMATAEIGLRELFYAYPAVLALSAGAIILRRGPVAGSTPAEPPAVRRFAWVLAGVCVAAVAYIALAYFPGAPLPGGQSVNYFPDYPRWIAIAADAKQQWPIGDPSVAGEPLPYHYFVYVHMAAVSQVTGLELSVVFLRLFILPLVVLLVLELVVAGRSFVRSAYAGLIAAGLAFFIGELRLDTRESFLAQTPFLGLSFIYLFRSPSYLLGLVVFVPLITLLGERLTARDGPPRIAAWLLPLIFMIGATDAKITILPLVLGALVLFAAAMWIVKRRVPVEAAVAAGLVLLVSGIVYVLQYRGHSSGLGLGAFASFDDMPAVSAFEDGIRMLLPGVPGEQALASAGGILFGLVGLLLAPLVGLVWMFRRHGLRVGAGRAWLLSLLAVGLLGAVTLDQPGVNSQLYFLFYGLVAGCILSAEGLRGAWSERVEVAGRARRLAALAVAFLVILAGLMAAPLEIDRFSGPDAEGRNYLFWYGGLALLLGLLYVAALRLTQPARWPAAALLSAAILAVGALATPIGSLWGSVTNPDRELAGKRITPELYSALRWIRDETPADWVIAVNNHWIDPNRVAPLAFDYSAFSERRVFLEGWAYSQRAFAEGYQKVGAGQVNPFADRFRLNQAAFSRGDRRALREMADTYDVRYLVVDRVNGFRADLPALRRAGRIVYRAAGVTVLELPRAQATGS